MDLRRPKVRCPDGRCPPLPAALCRRDASLLEVRRNPPIALAGLLVQRDLSEDRVRDQWASPETDPICTPTSKRRAGGSADRGLEPTLEARRDDDFQRRTLSTLEPEAGKRPLHIGRRVDQGRKLGQDRHCCSSPMEDLAGRRRPPGELPPKLEC